MFKYKWTEKNDVYVREFVAMFGDDFHRLDNRKAAFAYITKQWKNTPETFTTDYVLYSYDVPVLMLTIDHDALNNVNWCTVRFDYQLYRYNRKTIKHVSQFLTMISALYRNSPNVPTYGILKSVHEKHLQDETTFILGHTLFHKWGTTSFQNYIRVCSDFPQPVITQC